MTYNLSSIKLYSISSNLLHSAARSVPTEDGLFACITETFIELRRGITMWSRSPSNGAGIYVKMIMVNFIRPPLTTALTTRGWSLGHEHQKREKFAQIFCNKHSQLCGSKFNFSVYHTARLLLFIIMLCFNYFCGLRPPLECFWWNELWHKLKLVSA